MRTATLLLLIFACLLQAQEATSLKQAVAAYTDLYKLCIDEHKRVDGDVMEKVLKGLTSHFKEYPEAYIKAGDFYFQLGDDVQALREYQEGMAADDSRKILYEKRVIELLLRQKQMAEAYKLDKEILREHPEDPEARGLEASFKLDQGDTDAALAELQSIVRDVPDNFVVQFNLGRAYFAKGDMEKAREQFEAVLKIRPDYKPARLALTQLALRRGDPDTALKYAEDALKTDPDSGVSMLLEAAALLRKGQFDESRKMLERLLKTNPNQTDALIEMGVLDLAQKRYAEAEEPFRKAYTIDPANLRGLLGIAETYFDRNEPDKAVQLIAAEAQKQPQRTDLQKELANAEFRAKQFDQAIAVYQSILDRYKDVPLAQADVYSLIAKAWSAAGNLQKAIENMQKATQLAPANVGYISPLAQFYDNAGQRPEALAAYRDALKIDPDNGIVLNNLAYDIVQSGGDLDEALAFAQHARRQLPKMNEILDTVGWIYLKKALTASAVEVFRELVDQVPDNPTFHYHYAMALAQKGDKAAALQELDKALQYHPGPNEEKDIRELLQQVKSVR